MKNWALPGAAGIAIVGAARIFFGQRVGEGVLLGACVFLVVFYLIVRGTRSLLFANEGKRNFSKGFLAAKTFLLFVLAWFSLAVLHAEPLGFCFGGVLALGMCCIYAKLSIQK